MKLTKFWVVRDPYAVSELSDIFWESDPNSFARYCLGMDLMRFEEENHTFHTSFEEALLDAEARLAAVKKLPVE